MPLKYRNLKSISKSYLMLIRASTCKLELAKPITWRKLPLVLRMVIGYIRLCNFQKFAFSRFTDFFSIYGRKVMYILGWVFLQPGQQSNNILMVAIGLHRTI